MKYKAILLSLIISQNAFTKSKITVGELLSKVNEESRGSKTSSLSQKSSLKIQSGQLNFGKTEGHVDLNQIKPPKSKIYSSEESGDRVELERTLDQQIAELYKIMKKFDTSPNRGEYWLRMAELYGEKAAIIDMRKQDEFDQKLKDFQAGKIKKRPKLDTTEAREYNKKAVQLYEWFQRDFPRDEKMAQALFFLGYNHFELGNIQKGTGYFERLLKEHPKSNYNLEAYFSLGEYFFENEKWAKAYNNYSHLIKSKSHRLHNFSLYKGAWCLYRLGKYNDALKYLEYIIKDSSSKNKNKMGEEALRDIVLFYAHARSAKNANQYFKDLVGDNSFSYIEKLAYYYADKGDKESARVLFQEMTQEKATNPKAFDYQYQIVQNYFYAKNSPKFKKELYTWIKDFGPGSVWFEANKSNQELIDNSIKLRETTLRNYTLQQHQTAQNSKTTHSRNQASESYALYFQFFNDSKTAPDMHFYYGELLYDMGKYQEAAAQYKWVVENAKESKFASQAGINVVFAIEKSLPSDKELQRRVGKSVEPIELDPKVQEFITTAEWFIKNYPKNEKVPEIKFRIGRLYYQSNHFDEASAYFKDVSQSYPKTKYAEFSANLMLDIFNLKKDFIGLEKAGTELLKVPTIANSKAGEEIRSVLEKASFKKAQELATQQKYLESADMFVNFAKDNPKSELYILALFNSGINYEKANNNMAALQSYKQVQSSPDVNSKEFNAKDLKMKSLQFSAKILQESAQFKEAIEINKKLATMQTDETLKLDDLINAAVMLEATSRPNEAIEIYNSIQNKKLKENVKRDVLYSLANLYQEKKEYAKANERWIEFIDSKSSDKEKNIEAYYNVYHNHYYSKNKADAERWKNKTVDYFKKYSPENFSIGTKYIAQIKIDNSQSLFDDLKKIELPKKAEKQKAALDEKADIVTKINKQLTEVVKLNSANEIVDALTLLGQVNAHMEKAINNAPLPPGLNKDEQNQYKELLQKLAAPFAEKSKESFKSAYQRGQELDVFNESYFKAIEYLEKIESNLKLNFGEKSFSMRLVNLDKSLQDVSDSKLYDQATSGLLQDPNSVNWLNALGLYYYKRGQFKTAEYLLSKAIQKNPQDFSLYTNLGVVYLAMGEKYKAIKTMRKSIELNPNDSVSAANLGSLYLEAKDFEKALVATETAYKAGLKDYKLMNNYGVALMMTGDSKNAKDILDQALKLQSSSKEIMLNQSILLIEFMKEYKLGLDNINRLKFLGTPADLKGTLNQLESKARANLK